MDSQLVAALRQTGVATFKAVRLVLPSGTVRLCDGGTVQFGGETFTAQDAVWGALSSVDAIADGVDNQVSAAQIVIIPQSAQALADLSSHLAQGGEVSVWTGAADLDTGGVFGEPEVLFAGVINFATMTVTADGLGLSLDCIGEDAYQLRDDTEKRLNDAFHQSVWPGELGLQYVTDVTRTINWRVAGPSITSQTSQSGGGRGGVADVERF